VVTGLFPEVVRVGCVVAIVAAAAATASERDRPGGGWWTLFAIGAALSAIGAALAIVVQEAETEGGLVALGGAALVVIAATIGFPLGERD
jgi:hypothetical protein